MDESAMDHAVHGAGGAPQAVEVFKIAAMRLGARGGERLGRGVRPRQAEHLMARLEEFRNNGGADEASRSGDEDAHDDDP